MFDMSVQAPELHVKCSWITTKTAFSWFATLCLRTLSDPNETQNLGQLCCEILQHFKRNQFGLTLNVDQE